MGSFTARPTRCRNVERAIRNGNGFRALDHGNQGLDIQSGATGAWALIQRLWLEANFDNATLPDCEHRRSCSRALGHSAGTECVPSHGRSLSAEPKQFSAVLAEEFKDHGYCHDLLNRARD